MIKTVYKPWGKEEWLELNDKYCCKRIFINKGFRTSFQYHEKKKETNCLISGFAELWIEKNGFVIKELIKPGDFITINSPQKHRIIALTDIVLYETSTPEVDDVIRIQDDMQRGDGKIASEFISPPNIQILSDTKDLDEVTYKMGNRVFKFNKDESINQNRYNSWKRLEKHCPKNLVLDKYYISYDWEDGENLYKINSLDIFVKFLDYFNFLIKESNKLNCSDDFISSFYKNKNKDRKQKFITKYGSKLLDESFTINNQPYSPIQNFISNIKDNTFKNSFLYSNFHGDMHFTNILYKDKFTFLDWRESFNGDVSGGDIYYDLAKLYAGCLFPFSYFKLKNEVEFNTFNSNNVTYKYKISNELLQFTQIYEKWLIEKGFNLKIIKYITGLIFFNICMLHEDVFNKIFFFKSIELLNATEI